MMDLMKAVPGAKSVPQVMIGGKYVGGLQQVKEYLNRK
jgi:glutaredoxin